MVLNFTQFFKKYEAVSRMADDLFNKVKQNHSECVKCKMDCSDCCYALFDLTLIEALYLKQKIKENFSSEMRILLEEKSNTIDRALFKLKKKAYDDYKSGKSESEILEYMATKKIRCPLLNDKGMCELYEFRPITCRLYGIPFSIGGVGHTCGKSDFKEGENYPTVNMEVIHKKLYDISSDLTKHINSTYSKLSEILIPMSMVILTEFDDEFLGISNTK